MILIINAITLQEGRYPWILCNVLSHFSSLIKTVCMTDLVEKDQIITCESASKNSFIFLKNMTTNYRLSNNGSVSDV